MMSRTKNERSIRWIIGYGIYLVCATIAYMIMHWFDLWSFSTPILVIFLLGYLAGRISKGVEQ